MPNTAPPHDGILQVVSQAFHGPEWDQIRQDQRAAQAVAAERAAHQELLEDQHTGEVRQLEIATRRARLLQQQITNAVIATLGALSALLLMVIIAAVVAL